MKIRMFFRNPEDDLIRVRDLTVRTPGTKPTTRVAMEGARLALEFFKENEPVGSLHSVVGKNAAGNEELFQIRFLTEKDGLVAKG